MNKRDINMNTNNTHHMAFDDVIHTIALIISIVSLILAAKSRYNIEKLEESMLKSTYTNTSIQTADSHEELQSETIKYIDRTPSEYTITYGYFNPNVKQPEITTRTVTRVSKPNTSDGN